MLILDEPSDGLDPEGIHEMRQTILRLRRDLKLTILLSSHLLNEVQQLCTRIAVMKQGRKVYEGALTDATREGAWVRLRVGDFAQAATELRKAGLITGDRDGKFVALAKDAGSDALVRALVGLGMPVFEVAPEETTLEGFYLGLMKSS